MTDFYNAVAEISKKNIAHDRKRRFKQYIIDNLLAIFALIIATIGLFT